jgi:tripartite ATP-independent transporter DctM subunit
MTQIDPILLTTVMFGMMFLLMILGVPLAFTLGIVSVGTVISMWGPGGTSMLYFSALSVAYSYSLTAVPTFIFLGVVLEKSGIGENFYDTVQKWLGGIPGGLTIGTVVICVVVAAMVGQTGPATIMMGMIALPAMLKRRYDKRMITGAIQAGGALGILIPPSVTFIMYGFLAGESVGRLFAAGIFPGLLMGFLFCLYIYIRCKFQPHLGPPVPINERASFKEKVISLKGMILPGFLIFVVLGLIILGVTSPTEAAGVGAFGSLVCAALSKRLTWKLLRESVLTTGRIMGIIMWILIPAVAFSKIYQGLGAQTMVDEFIKAFGFGPYGVLSLMLISYYILGCFLETGAILFLTVPLYVPTIVKLGFDPVWFGVIYVMCMESAYLTPPYGFNLFYMKSIAPKEITLVDIYRSVIPFVGLQIFATIIVVIFPEIALWLPKLTFSLAK